MSNTLPPTFSLSASHTFSILHTLANLASTSAGSIISLSLQFHRDSLYSENLAKDFYENSCASVVSMDFTASFSWRAETFRNRRS